MYKIKKLGIANRGEVAVRILHAAHELGIQTVLLHSEADVGSIAYRLAKERVCIGPSPVNESYLNIEANILAAKSAGAEAIHPGFGFLSENPAFAEACERNHILFVGPSPESIRLFGDKISAKKLVKSLGCSMVPDYLGESRDMQMILKECEKIGFPLIVKAAEGGGGRGLKIARDLSQAQEAIESARREGKASFGSDRIFLEKYLEKAKHIEVQIFGCPDGRVLHLWERECSVQRRHQKVIEEAGAADLAENLRRELVEAAVEIGRRAKYLGAGTVEFLVQDNKYYFMEMNTRLQVEHPVTEMTVGVDLVKAQIMAACGLSPLWEQRELRSRGHAIECRIYTEDPYQGGIPSTGKLGGMHWPQGAGRRFEVGFESGDEITSFYDSMIAKVVVWDETRIRAIQKMRQTLSETVIFGLRTNIPYLQEILKHPEFVDGSMTTRFIETEFPQGLVKPEMDSELVTLMESLAKKIGEGSGYSGARLGGLALPNPLEIAQWRPQ